MSSTPNDTNAAQSKGSKGAPLFVSSSTNCRDDSITRIQVDQELAKNLEQHQREGVEFLWQNCFCDFNLRERGDESKIGGCILAHYMGLGKSLTTLAALHTVLTASPLTDKKAGFLHTVLLVAPANTITNWLDEVEKWTGDLDNPIEIISLGVIKPSSREREINRWKKKGGILLLSESLFLKSDITSSEHPDVLVVDEAHTMLKNSGTKIYKRLLGIRTKRRILLTGTPLQNNVTEYYTMCEYIRPGAIGVDSEKAFNDKYRVPIEDGLHSDAPREAKINSLQLKNELKTKLDPYVHRKGKHVLDHLCLPPLKDNVLLLQPSTLQERLLVIEQRARKDGVKSKNLMSFYSRVAPILNHPATIKLARATRDKKKKSWKSEEDVQNEWFMKATEGIDSRDFEKLEEAKSSPKLIILAHIIALVLKNREKLLIYSKDLKTLDVIELFLEEADWKSHIKSLREMFKEDRLGGWKKGNNYIRIDGAVDSDRRGELVEKFKKDKSIKAFLISSLAGGIGINLCAANVVVMMDSHWTPTISYQCISRAHRLGQTKPVYCFRLAIQNSMEEKIYARSVNKDGVAMQVVDGNFSETPYNFTEAETQDLQTFNVIKTCNKCKKKRRLIGPELFRDDKKWYCQMNSDQRYSTCKIPQEQNVEKPRRGPLPVVGNAMLEHVLRVIEKQTRKSVLVKDYIPAQIKHKAHVDCQEAINKLNKAKSNVSGMKRKSFHETSWTRAFGTCDARHEGHKNSQQQRRQQQGHNFHHQQQQPQQRTYQFNHQQRNHNHWHDGYTKRYNPHQYYQQQHPQPQTPSPTQQQQQQQQNQRHSGNDAKYAKTASQSKDTMKEIRDRILNRWARQAPQLQKIRPITILIASMHTVFTPAVGLSPHAYFQKWKPIKLGELFTANGVLPDEAKLKKSVRKLRFFLHPDKLPHDFDEEQKFAMKLLWNITNESWEEHQKQRVPFRSI